jgi:hypothetical protein
VLWNQIVTDHGEMLYRAAYRILHDHGAAEDVVQDVLLEAFALLTLGIGVIWCASTWCVLGSFRELSQGAFVASLSFWLIVLLYFLGNIYSARLHSYGFPSRAPSAVICLLATNLAVLLAGHLWARWRGKYAMTYDTS